MTNRATRSDFSLTEAILAEKGSISQLVELTADLIQARERAEMIKEPLLAYFIDMAIAQLRAMMFSRQDCLPASPN